ncbi:hypothetical protein [Desulfonema limicola]|nr:hypothetical protein [Desulfonema limicola]
MNWVSMKPGSKEYYLFHPLEKKGIDKSRWTIFSYDENGNLKRLPDEDIDENIPKLSDIKTSIFNKAKNQDIKTEQGLRSESYWRVPTFLDRRLIDLDFKERYSGKNFETGTGEPGMEITCSELVELYFLKIIVNQARNRLY